MDAINQKILNYFSYGKIENKSDQLFLFFQTIIDKFKKKTINNELKNINFDKNNTEKLIELVFYL